MRLNGAGPSILQPQQHRRQRLRRVQHDARRHTANTAARSGREQLVGHPLHHPPPTTARRSRRRPTRRSRRTRSTARRRRWAPAPRRTRSTSARSGTGCRGSATPASTRSSTPRSGRGRGPDGHAATDEAEYDRGECLPPRRPTTTSASTRSRSSTALRRSASTARPYEQDFTIPANAPAARAAQRGRRGLERPDGRDARSASTRADNCEDPPTRRR